MRKIFLLGLLFFFFFLGCVQSNTMKAVTDNSLVCVGVHCVSVEIASTPQERAKGLMFRDHLGDGNGMLFVFEEEGRHGFWMKNTLIPLDVVWISDKEKIVSIQTLFPCEKEPCSLFYPGENAVYVLEVNAGLMKDWNVSVGEKVSLFVS